MWLLQGIEPDVGSLSFRLPAGTTRTLGRAQSADFIIEAPLVSRLHCRIAAAGIGERELREGDRLRIGRVDFTVLRVDA